MEWIGHIFLFSKDDIPMTFVNLGFWILFLVIYAGFALTYKRIFLRNIILFVLSLFFYYKTSGLFVLLLIFSTLSDFFLGKLIFSAETKNLKKTFLILSIFINLIVLFYFKYAYFFTESYNFLFNTNHEVFNYLAKWGNDFTGLFSEKSYFTVDKIILPVGISFYTFQTISYSVDIYRDKIKPLNSVLDFGLYVAFFPQLVAGPIVRAESFVPQIVNETNISKENFNSGTFLIFKGLIKKMIFGDFIASEFLDRVFEMPSMYSGFTNLMALVGYSLQVYGDFSGYTDIAIGLALLMGFYLPKNFDSPYKATSCSNFWKRWHLSLSSWLRDYLYIPLGGNKGGSWGAIIISLSLVIVAIIGVDNPFFSIGVGLVLLLGTILAYFSEKFRNSVSTNINLMLTMLIGGLWHGASWKFLVWGGLNGLGIVFNKFWKKISPYENSQNILVRFWKIFSTFCFIVFVRLYFRGEDLERINLWYEQVFHNFGLSGALTIISYFRWAFVVILVGFVTHWLPQSWKDKIEEIYSKSHFSLKILVAILIVFLCLQVYSSGYQPFIYFQF